MKNISLAVLAFVLLASAAPARAQNNPAREGGRGLQYGAHLMTPILFTDVQRAGGGATAPVLNPAGGLNVRVGVELPAGFAVELQGGFAFHYVDHACPDTATECLRRSMSRVHLGAAVRYHILNDSIVVPFFEAGGGLRMISLDFDDGGEQPSPGFSVGVTAGGGIQLELAPYFDFELGVLFDYVFTMDGLFDEPGLIGIRPFVGVTLFIEDADDPIF